MRKVLIAIGIVVGGVIIASQARAQGNALMYGTVTTLSGDTYTGPIRWGDDEVYWLIGVLVD